MKRLKAHAALFWITCFLAYFSSLGATVSTPEDYTLQTLYILNFTKYIEWPSGNNVMKIGVVDNSLAEEYLAKMAKAKSKAGSEITIINTKNEGELGSCQIIFIPSNNTQLTAKFIERFAGQPILIVTEDADLIKKGASVSFKLVSGKLRFQINEEAIKANRLKISGALISLAEK